MPKHNSGKLGVAGEVEKPRFLAPIRKQFLRGAGLVVQSRSLARTVSQTSIQPIVVKERLKEQKGTWVCGMPGTVLDCCSSFRFFFFFTIILKIGIGIQRAQNKLKSVLAQILLGLQSPSLLNGSPGSKGPIHP